MNWKSIAAHPELGTVVLLALALAIGDRTSPHFFGALLGSSPLYVEAGLLALGMTFTIVAGQIDLSVASSLVLVACVVGKLSGTLPMPVACLAGLALGALLGAGNGLLIGRFRLPSFLVTLGTFALYRGLAHAIMGSKSAKLPDSFVGIDAITPLGIPAPLLALFGVAVILALLLHRTVFGREVFAVGGNAVASRYAGIHRGRIMVLLFMLNGLLAAGAALLMDSRLGVARHDLAQGLELDAIVTVVLGGASIYGGSGTVLGTMIGFCLMASVKTMLQLANVRAEIQFAVLGSLLAVAVIARNLTYSGRRATSGLQVE